jgi:hypothetical protein
MISSTNNTSLDQSTTIRLRVGTYLQSGALYGELGWSFSTLDESEIISKECNKLAYYVKEQLIS